jgi:hypothetical protein
MRQWKRERTFREAESDLKIRPRQRQNLIKTGKLRVVGAGRLRRVTLKSIRRYNARRLRAKRVRYGWPEPKSHKGQMVTFRVAEERLGIGPRQRQNLAKAGNLQVVDGMVTLRSVRRYDAHRRKKVR